ncbi:hypothetical protein C1930_14260 [Stenotrophomonas sp. SAU14A_NAIMI4_8]|nr:hypothetical protein C1930_14260 [Stenotrophomonas sp. SAU14A_NAIMI4_8]
MPQLSQRLQPSILALDLEGTLISNAVSQIPRPGLLRFLGEIKDIFSQLVLFTTVPEPQVRNILSLLAEEGEIPDWFKYSNYIQCLGSTKDLLLVSPLLGTALLLDDHQSYIHPGQEKFWIKAPLFASPYSPHDDGLEVALTRIRRKVSMLSEGRVLER